jgi:hypothetical protein
VLCCVKRRQPPDVSLDGLKCILNFCDCSVAVVGGEWLPSSSINSAFASPVFSHFLLLFTQLFFPPLPPWARVRKVAVLLLALVTSANVSRLLLRRTSATRSTRRRSSPLSPRDLRLPSLPWHRLMIQTTPRGLPRRSTYIRAVERSGLEGSDESEYSSDEEDSSDSSEEGSGDDGGDDDDDGGNGGGGGDSGRGGDGGSKGGNGSGSKGSNKASG